MQKKPVQDKDFCDLGHRIINPWYRILMPKPKSINELLETGGTRLTALRERSLRRQMVLQHVCASLPARLAASVVSAGIEKGRLTIAVSGAHWASRLRYAAGTVQSRVGESMGMEITQVRIKVVPPQA